jgi:hypothetical protein
MLNNLEALFKKIEELGQQCSKPDWDGYGAEPVLKETVDFTKKFINVLSELPDEIPTPDLSADPDGAISFEWFNKDPNFPYFWITLQNNKLICLFKTILRDKHADVYIEDLESLTAKTIEYMQKPYK